MSLDTLGACDGLASTMVASCHHLTLKPRSSTLAWRLFSVTIVVVSGDNLQEVPRTATIPATIVAENGDYSHRFIVAGNGTSCKLSALCKAANF